MKIFQRRIGSGNGPSPLKIQMKTQHTKHIFLFHKKAQFSMLNQQKSTLFISFSDCRMIFSQTALHKRHSARVVDNESQCLMNCKRWFAFVSDSSHSSSSLISHHHHFQFQFHHFQFQFYFSFHFISVDLLLLCTDRSSRTFLFNLNFNFKFNF